MKTVKFAAVVAALIALSASGATARQAGYVYLQCNVAMNGSPGPQTYRIGNGQWDFLDNPYWEALEWVNCGEQRRRDNFLYTRNCSFNDRQFRSEINIRHVMPGMEGFSISIQHNVDRDAGTMGYSYLSVNETENRRRLSTCKPIQDPGPPQRKF
ncbi:hypothetical protein [Caulobacter henricii]|uniref:Uncharacterized protein n=1 Tax=Caulobacter henricii TaxID=69395 RepID=A0A0P0P111_9CAUL|nr:hypothetical protein [Caulobacter henricii]ALL14180.1 hypothetical protein AQ619_12990 [Caulobacter henricii]